MTTNRTRAEQIAETYLGLWKCDLSKKESLAKEIEQALDEAVRDAIIEKFEGDDCVVARLEHEAYAKGTLAGLEMSRVLALEHRCEFRICGTIYTCKEQIATAIDAKAKELEGGK